MINLGFLDTCFKLIGTLTLDSLSKTSCIGTGMEGRREKGRKTHMMKGVRKQEVSHIV